MHSNDRSHRSWFVSILGPSRARLLIIAASMLIPLSGWTQETEPDTATPADPPSAAEPSQEPEAPVGAESEELPIETPPAAEQQPPAPAAAAPAPAAPAREAVEEIVVTGSRIKRSNLTTPVPVTALGSEDIGFSGEMDLSQLAQEMPALLNSITSDQSLDADDVTPGLALLNLRSLGTKRTLVLVNGRRHVGGRAGDTAVDVNTIPMSLVDRVEVLTGGASAIYGADAVSGVVNFIMKKDYQGTEAHIRYGLAGAGDAPELLVSVLSGGNFAEARGNATFSLQYGREGSIRYRDRAFSRNNGIASARPNPALYHQWSETDDPDLVGTRKDPAPKVTPYAIRKNMRWAISSLNGIIGFDMDGDGYPDEPGATSFTTDVNNNGIDDVRETFLGPYYGSLIYEGGQLRVFQDGVIAGFANQFGGDGVPSDLEQQSLIPETDRLVANGALRFSLLPNVSYFGELKFVYGESSNVGNVNSFNDSIPIRRDNPYIPAELVAALDNFVATNPGYEDAQLLMTRDLSDLGLAGSTVNRYTLRLVTGFEGELDNGFTYELSFNYGRTFERNTSRNWRIEDRFFAAVDAVRDPATGAIVCRSDLDPTAIPPTAAEPFFRGGFLTFEPGDGQCRPLNLFGNGAPSREAIDFVTIDDNNTDVIEQQVLMGVVSGNSSDYFELPAGPLGFAAGVEYRREASSSRYSGLDQAKLLFGSGSQSLSGSYDVWEGYAELLVPILRDTFLAREVSLEGAVRVADYSTVGLTTTYQGRAVWAPVSDVRVRGSYSRAIRAPNVSELYQPLTVTLFRVEDPCAEVAIGTGPNAENRLRNCRAAGIPEGFQDPLTSRQEGLSGGNQDLEEERADSYTVGLVLTPSFLPNLAVTADFWSIDMAQAIEFLDEQDIVDKCYDLASLDNPFCRRLRRDPDTLGIVYIEQTQLNIAAREVRGLDVSAHYRVDILDGRGGVLDITGVGTYLHKQIDIQVEDDPSSRDPERGELTRPRFAFNTDLRYRLGGLAVGYQLRWLASQLLGGVEWEKRDLYTPNETGDAWMHDAQVRYRVLDQLEVYAGVNNLTNRRPFITEANYPVSSVGRFFYAGVVGSLD